MPEHKVAVIRGDGIGIEVIGEAIRVLESVEEEHDFSLKFTEYPWGTDYYFEHGEMMASDGLDLMAEHEAVFLGAVGHPDVQDHITLNGLLLPIRRSFDQYVNERPSVLYPGITSPLAGKKPYDIDMMCIRENTEGEYADVGGFLYPGTPEEIAVQSSVFTRKGCERVITYAFEMSRKRNKRKHLTSITKSNALGYGMVLWDRTFESVAAKYPDVETNSLLIDAACMDFVRRPESFDVVVASNLFGDILTDIGAIITGSMGLAASANIDPSRRSPSMFEPVHGTAPDIVGQGIANPMAAVLSASMMLRHLGEDVAAEAIDKAVFFLLEQGEITTPDLGGSSSTSQVGDAIISALGK